MTSHWSIGRRSAASAQAVAAWMIRAGRLRSAELHERGIHVHLILFSEAPRAKDVPFSALPAHPFPGPRPQGMLTFKENSSR